VKVGPFKNTTLAQKNKFGFSSFLCYPPVRSVPLFSRSLAFTSYHYHYHCQFISPFPQQRDLLTNLLMYFHYVALIPMLSNCCTTLSSFFKNYLPLILLFFFFFFFFFFFKLYTFSAFLNQIQRIFYSNEIDFLYLNRMNHIYVSCIQTLCKH
jgi:hypothetical protein